MKRKIVGIIFILMIMVGFITYEYIYKEHRNIGNEEAVFKGNASEIYSEFNQNNDGFNANYLDKTIEIEGEISEIETTSLILNDKVYVVFTDTLDDQILIDQKIAIKGRYVGYDDLLEVLKIDQAMVINK